MTQSNIQTVADFHRAIAERLRAQREAVRLFVQGAVTGDLKMFSLGIDGIETQCVWKEAFRAVSRHSAPLRFRKKFTASWLSHGDHMRCEVSDDLILIAGLRALLPPYAGGPMELYRGDSAFNRRHRTYGLSWSSDLEVARGFASGIWRTHKGGSVVLTAIAPPEAIISVPGAKNDRYGEKEYLVDRRLVKVTVVERLSQVSISQRET